MVNRVPSVLALALGGWTLVQLVIGAELWGDAAN